MNITINGTIRGKIWMPAIECEKDFTYQVKADETLRDAVLHITNDGDFQGCDLLANSYIKAVMYKQNKVITRYFDITSPLFTSIKDCVLDDYPIFNEV